MRDFQSTASYSADALNFAPQLSEQTVLYTADGAETTVEENSDPEPVQEAQWPFAPSLP
jgi:hypothetical protein